jgi:hypothetical protein
MTNTKFLEPSDGNHDQKRVETEIFKNLFVKDRLKKLLNGRKVLEDLAKNQAV